GFDGTCGGGSVGLRPPSLGLCASGSFSMGKPSMTYSGSLLPVTDDPPRMRIDNAAPGADDACVTMTPGAAPASVCSSESVGVWATLGVTEATEPVRSDRRCAP